MLKRFGLRLELGMRSDDTVAGVEKGWEELELGKAVAGKIWGKG